ncbi:MAG: metallophosphoesterase [Bacteroidetes bacterium]|nr:metallophosphoesterase [Bacteroidota bacterium]
MFIYIILLIILLLQIFLFVRLKGFLSGGTFYPRWSIKAGAGVFLFFNIPFFVFVIFLRKQSQLPVEIVPLMMPFFIWQSATIFISLILTAAAVTALPLTMLLKTISLHPVIKTKVEDMKQSQKFKSIDASRRAFLRSSAVGLSAYSFIGAAAGTANEGEFEIIRKTITIPNLPEKFKGFTIGMMSDIHSSVFMNKDDMSGYVRSMNELKTDLIVVTGDFVNSKTEEVYPFAEAFSELRAEHGVYGCLGNHDFFSRDVELVAKKVDECGVRLLRNDAVKIQKDGAFFNLVGVDDIGRNIDPADYMNKALAFAKNDQPKILLCHKPYYFQQAKDLGIDLTLSGHTHGGQIVFGVVDSTRISLATLASKYISGLYTLGSSNLYVNNGIGFTGLPVRINCPAELTVITLA